METTRQNKIGRLIQKELGNIFLDMTRNEQRGSIISVSVVRVSPDLSVAKAYLSVFPSEKRDEIMAYIAEKNWEIRHTLATKVRHQLRIIPELEFFPDDSLDYLENIDNLLKK